MDVRWSRVLHPLGVDHPRLHKAVPQRLLNRAKVLAPLQKMGGERLALALASGGFVDLCRQHGSAHRRPNEGSDRCDGDPVARWPPLASGRVVRTPICQLHSTGALGQFQPGHGDAVPGPTIRQIRLMHSPHLLRVVLEPLPQEARQRGVSIISGFASLTVSPLRREIHVLYRQR